jgi:hypothetical protein
MLLKYCNIGSTVYFRLAIYVASQNEPEPSQFKFHLLTACPRGLFGREFIGVIKYFCLSVENTVKQNDLIIKANVICVKLLRVSTRSVYQQAYDIC